jgi:GTP cyclohydrolase I
MQDTIIKKLEDIFICMGVNLENEHFKDTPKRVAKLWMELFKASTEEEFEFTTFTNESYKDWIIERDIPFTAFCAHHLMPFYGTVDIGYVPGGKLAGASKIPRTVKWCSKLYPTLQESLGNSVLENIQYELEPEKLVVRINCTHTCIACRGVETKGITMVTYHANRSADIQEFLQRL